MLCSSYSGNTEETLSAYDDALERGAPRLVATTGGALAERARRDGVPVIPLPGGFQPRAAVGYGLVSALEAAALAGAAPSMRDEIEAAAALAGTLAAEWGPEGAEDGEAKALARALHGTVPVIVGAELTAPVAYRWKCQINENAGLPAFSSALPEADHNEVVGWPGAGGLGPFSAVFLEDPTAHPRNLLPVRAHRRRGPRGSEGRRAHQRPRRDTARAARLARAARRPRLALHGGARGHRPGRHRADRPSQGLTGRALATSFSRAAGSDPASRLNEGVAPWQLQI